MNPDIISPKTRQLFREWMVASMVLRTISDEFDAARIHPDLEYHPPRVSGERRTLIEQYFHTVDWVDWTYVKKAIQVFESVLKSAEAQLKDHEKTLGKQSRQTFEKLIWSLEKDGFQWIGSRIEAGSRVFSLQTLKESVSGLSYAYLADQIRRMETSVQDDPELAIGTAKELIETCCKSILAERGKPLPGSPDIPALTKATLKELELVPEGVPERARGQEVIKRLLSNLGTIGNALAELRGLYGTGHGKDGNSSGLGPRHAKLATGAAATLATFLFETHKEKQ
jgi:hypothetical protein